MDKVAHAAIMTSPGKIEIQEFSLLELAEGALPSSKA